jgi:S-adenosylmethionine:tRNA ribosyltransferase-isomerase
LSASVPVDDDEPDGDRLALYDYSLEGVRIAATPSDRRDASRLLVHDRSSGRTDHATFADLPRFLAGGDRVVVNDTRVVTARLFARRSSGGRVEVVLHPTGSDERSVVLALVKPSARVKAGETLVVERDLPRLVVLDRPGAELRRVRVEGGSLDELLRAGHLPLPPYLPRESSENGELPRSGLELPLDRERYQTVYAQRPGAIAAPTAGLHFTPELFERLRERGVETTKLTLHVGPGTFLPVRSERLSQHAMHEELYELSEEAAAEVERTKAAGGRVVAIGTTTTRALEAAALAAEPSRLLAPGRARTSLMIRPGHRFRVVDALVTNFHLPRTTLLALVAAFAGRERTLALYREAAALRYRFYSYGDAMLIL